LSQRAALTADDVPVVEERAGQFGTANTGLSPSGSISRNNLPPTKRSWCCLRKATRPFRKAAFSTMLGYWTNSIRTPLSCAPHKSVSAFLTRKLILVLL